MRIESSYSGAARLRRRVTLENMVEVPLSLNDDGRYTLHVNVGPRDSAQSFNLTIATNLGTTLVAGSNCTTCNSAPSYNLTKSTSGRNLTTIQAVPIVPSVANGTVVKDDIRIPEKNGSTIDFASQTILSINTYSEPIPLFTEANSGILGLGLNGTNFTIGDTLAGSYFQQVFGASQFVYGLALKEPWTSDKENAGSLHLGAADPNSYYGELTWSNNTAVSKPSDPIPLAMNADWLFQVQGWSVTSKWASIPDQTGGVAVIEPFVPHIYIPQLEAVTLYMAVLGSNFTVQGDYMVWTMPCTSDLKWSVMIDGQTFTVPPTATLIGRGNECEGAIRAWANETQTGYLLGSSFISSVYSVFAIGREGKSSSAVALGQRLYTDSGSEAPVGPIVGGVLGGVALIGILAIAVWLYMRYFRDKARVRSIKPPKPPKAPKPEKVKETRSFLRF